LQTVRTTKIDVRSKRLILSHNKQLLRGDYLIDDRTAHRAVGSPSGRRSHLGMLQAYNVETWKNGASQNKTGLRPFIQQSLL